MKTSQLRILLLLVCVAPSARADFLDLQESAELGTQAAAPGDGLGAALEVSGDTAVAGAFTPGGGHAGFVYVHAAGVWTQQAMLVGPDTVLGDNFGQAVGIDGDTVVIGAPRDDTAGGTAAGSAYVFVRSGTSWSFQQQLLASDAAAEDNFASSLSISGDTVLVGAPRVDDLGNASGSSYVFVRTGTVWNEQAEVQAPDGSAEDLFGLSAALDGDTALLGAPSDDTGTGVDAGSCYVFTRSGTNWSLQEKITLSFSVLDGAFGSDVDLEGDRALITGRLISGLPVVRTYTRTGNDWFEEKVFYDGTLEGDFTSAAVSLEGQYVLVGAPLSNAAYLFNTVGPLHAEATYHIAAGLTGNDTSIGDDFGMAVALAGNQVLVGAPRHDDPVHDAGSVYVADILPGTPCELPEAMLSGWGRVVSVSGDTAAIRDGHVRIHVTDGSSWTSQALIVAQDPLEDSFGDSLALDGETLAIGAGTEADPGVNSGAAYVYTRSGTSWSEQAKLEPADLAPQDNFGFDVDLDGDTLVAGSFKDDDLGNLSGAAYVFVRNGTVWSEQAKLLASDGANADFLGRSVAISGDTVVAGANKSDSLSGETGAVYVFTRSGTTWSEEARLVGSEVPDGDFFGHHVALDGDTLVASGLEASYVFVRSGTLWSEHAKLPAVETTLPNTVALDGNKLVLGSETERSTGTAKLYVRAGTSWSLDRELVADDLDFLDGFGVDVALDGEIAIVATLLQGCCPTLPPRAYAYRLFSEFPSFCDASDQALASCPCSNPGLPDSGCDIAVPAMQGGGTSGGVRLDVLAQEVSPSNRVTLTGTGYPPASTPSSIVIRASSLDSAAPIIFGDGLRCVGVPLVRLGGAPATVGVSTHIFGHGAMAGTGPFYYQLWFRNAPLSFCDPTEAFNLSNGRTITW
jgi:hypothetical protein